MGQDISIARFKQYDFHQFDLMIEREMEVFRAMSCREQFSTARDIGGLELEAWLVDRDGRPTPWNAQVIARANSGSIVPELSRFNLEFNATPQRLAGQGIDALATELQRTWETCEAAANQLGASLVATGILPTITDAMLSPRNMSQLHRYHALNEQVLRLRQGQPIRLSISGPERIVAEHRDVMLEAATTSFQLHLQVPLSESVRYYNAAIVASAPTVAVASNSPLMFNKLLWEETRVPVFEQAVDVGGSWLPRVSFGSGYARESLEEVFVENQSRFPVLLPLVMDTPPEQFAHVRLHNGTIWRWNRPLIGMDDDGTPHLRIEHRVMSAGPTMVDMTANMAFYYGLLENLAHDSPAPESRLLFSEARANFYRAAKSGLPSDVRWLDGRTLPLRSLLQDELLPRAAEGLRRLRVDHELATRLITVIEERIRCGQTGAVWQRRFWESHGRDPTALTRAYRDLQQADAPVHTWPLDRRETGNATTVPRSMLRIVHELPTGMLETRAGDLAQLLGHPTLIHLPGRRPEPLFVSVLLHGNEDVGLLAIQAWLRRYTKRVLPRAVSIFVGNVSAAQTNVRFLPNQPDYNRVWPGANSDGTPEHAMMRHVVDEMKERNVFASVDLHNNTGVNPQYACVTRLDYASLQLAALFGRTAVYFERPYGVQTKAFAQLCPSVTCECGKVGDASGVRHAAEFLDACARLAQIPDHAIESCDLHLFHTVATVNVARGVTLDFVDSAEQARGRSCELCLRRDLERLNFRELQAGSHLGWTRAPSPIRVTSHTGRDVTDTFIAVDKRILRLCKPVIPAMLTSNRAVIYQDCLGYFMERYSLPEHTAANQLNR